MSRDFRTLTLFIRFICKLYRILSRLRQVFWHGKSNLAVSLSRKSSSQSFTGASTHSSRIIRRIHPPLSCLIKFPSRALYVKHINQYFMFVRACDATVGSKLDYFLKISSKNRNNIVRSDAYKAISKISLYVVSKKMIQFFTAVRV